MSQALNSLLPLLADIEEDPKGWASALIGALEDRFQVREIATGTINYWANDNNIPVGWRECDGTIVKQESFSELYNVIGGLWNTGGEASDEFRLPNLTAENFTNGFWKIKL